MACTGLIPADGDVWKARRRAIVPSLHRKYIENMVRMFGDSALHGVSSLQQAHQVWPAASSEAILSACGTLSQSCGTGILGRLPQEHEVSPTTA